MTDRTITIRIHLQRPPLAECGVDLAAVLRKYADYAETAHDELLPRVLFDPIDGSPCGSVALVFWRRS